MRSQHNGYIPSILDTTPGVCYICGRHGDTARHEILYGTANRRQSKAAGLWIDVCPDCHTRIHAGQVLGLKEIAQEAYERTHTRAQFMELFGRSYL